MAGSYTKAKGYLSFYYRCGNHWHRPEQEPCPNEGKTLSTRKAEPVVWAWFSELLENPEILAKGFLQMEQQTADEMEPKRQRLEAVNALIEKSERKMQRLVSALGDEEEDEDQTVIETFKAEIRTVSRHRKSLEAERLQLGRDLARRSITPAMKEKVYKTVEAILWKLVKPTFEQKRELFDLFNLEVIFRNDDSGRWLDVKCHMKPEGDVIVLDHSLAFSRLKRASPLPGDRSN
jgi:hypothetical protein